MIQSLHRSSVPLVEVEELTVSFKNAEPVVKGISFSLHPGECFALVGESGSGKSVTCRALIGLAGQGAKVNAGLLRLNGRDVLKLGEGRLRQMRGKEIGYVMQDALGSLDPLRSVGSEISESLRLHGQFSSHQIETKVLQLLGSVGISEAPTRARQYPFQLSGGLRQRALIASAIACGPSILVADEPTTSLDAVIQSQILDLLESLQTAENGMILISHDLAVVSRLADRVAVMCHGTIVEHGSAEAIFNDPQHSYTKSLLAASLTVHGIDLPESVTCFSPEQIEIEDIAPKTILEAKNLTKTFVAPDGTKRTAVSNASFSLKQGRTLGIVGESGSGKTTLIRMILGLESPDRGEVEINGRVWSRLTPSERRAERKRIQVIFQDPLASFDPRYTVEHVIGEALDISGYQPATVRRERIIELLDQVRLNKTHLHRRPIELSGGQRQRIAIARALAPRPDILVCDEPVSSLDISVQAQILELLDDLKFRLGLSTLFISHDLGIIRRVSEDVLVMKSGSIVESGPIDEVFKNPRHPYSKELLNAIPRFQKSSLINA